VDEAPIFIVGCPRSGTGLLRDLLRSHTRLAFPPESHFIPDFYRGFGDPRSDREARWLAGRILRLKWVRGWDLALEASSLAHCRSYRQLISALYRQFARREGKARWGDKTPRYVEEIPLLLELFPAARIIHIYRDGRDVALSWLATHGGPANLYTAATAWKRIVAAGRRHGRTHADAYLEIRYETLLGQPEVTMRRVCAFIAEDFEPAVLRPSRRPPTRVRRIVGRPRHKAFETEIAASNADRWRREMRPRERSLFEGVAGDLLADLDYETEGASRSLSPRRRLACRAHQRWRTLARSLYIREPSPGTFLFLWEARIRSWLHVTLPDPEDAAQTHGGP
jgi:sulfotransferase family protein